MLVCMASVSCLQKKEGFFALQTSLLCGSTKASLRCKQALFLFCLDFHCFAFFYLPQPDGARQVSVCHSSAVGFSVSSTGQWSLPKISVCIVAPSTSQSRRRDTMK